MKKAKKVSVRFTRKPAKKVRTKAQRRAAALKSWADRKAKAELDAAGIAKAIPTEDTSVKNVGVNGMNNPDWSAARRFVLTENHVSIVNSDGAPTLLVNDYGASFRRTLTPQELVSLVQQAVPFLPTP